jgi:hypothetical protein
MFPAPRVRAAGAIVPGGGRAMVMRERVQMFAERNPSGAPQVWGTDQA